LLAALQHLIDAQRIDAKVAALERDRAVYPKRLAELQQKLDHTSKGMSQLETQVTDKERERRALEGTLQLDVIKLKKWESRLADIRNQREYLALSREVDGQRKQNTENQEKILALVHDLDTQKKQLETTRDGFAEQDIDLQTERDAIEKKLAELDAQIAEHNKERAEFLHDVPAPLLKRYDQIRQKRAGIALAPAEKGRCTMCNIGLPPQMYNIIIRGDTIETCPNCNRLLYYRAPQESQEEAPHA
jgi:predicted  nucleic acid-binding Zn-ribbon protein